MKRAAVDTNVLVRLATGDSPAEHRRIVAALANRSWLVLGTVLLETEGVLRSRYGYSPTQFASSASLSIDDITARFTSRGPWKKRVGPLLDMLVALGRASEKDGRYRARG